MQRRREKETEKHKRREEGKEQGIQTQSSQLVLIVVPPPQTDMRRLSHTQLSRGMIRKCPKCVMCESDMNIVPV